MSTTPTSVPRWKAIRDELHGQLAQHEYGSNFYSIADICKKFDVSVITARRVLDELASEGLVEKIRRRGTVVRRISRTIKVRLVVPSAVRPDYFTYSGLMRRQIAGITEYARLNNIDFDFTNEAHIETLFGHRENDFGLLLPGPMTSRTLDFLRSRRMPHVNINPVNSWKGMLCVRADRFQAGYMATQFLLGLGHRRIAYVLGRICQRNFRDRVRGYKLALKEAGLRLDWSLIHETDGTVPEQDHQAVAELLALRSPPTAIITGDDEYRAIHILQYLKGRGIDVPGQISVLGYPNSPDSQLTDPPLSVLDGCYEQIGAAAIRLLVNLMLEPQRASALRSLVIRPRMAERATTAPPPKKKKAN